MRVGSQLAASSLRAAALPTYSRSSRYPSIASIVLTARYASAPGSPKSA